MKCHEGMRLSDSDKPQSPPPQQVSTVMSTEITNIILRKLEHLEKDMTELKLEIAEMKSAHRRMRWIWGGAGAVLALAGKEIVQWAVAYLLPKAH